MKFTAEEARLVSALLDTFSEISRLPVDSKGKLEEVVERFLSRTFNRREYSDSWKSMVT